MLRPNEPSRARHYAILTPAERKLVGLSRFELLTPRLSSVCSNQLSYRPGILAGILPGVTGIQRTVAGSFKTR